MMSLAGLHTGFKLCLLKFKQYQICIKCRLQTTINYFVIPKDIKFSKAFFLTHKRSLHNMSSDSDAQHLFFFIVDLLHLIRMLHEDDPRRGAIAVYGKHALSCPGKIVKNNALECKKT
jgi:hypothetical protein